MHTSNTAQVKDNIEIFNLLKNIQKSKQPISLSLKSLPQLCLTSLLEVQKDKNILIFDEPNPTLSKEQIEKRNEVEFSLKLQNLPIVFKTRLISNKNTNELQTYFPKEIYYPQHRGYYRFRTEFINDIETTIFLSSTSRLPGKLLDISLNGLCLRLPYSFSKKFKVNQIINDIYIQLPNQNGFSVSAKVKNSRTENNYTGISLGLEIQQQKHSIEKTIQQFIYRTKIN